MQFPEIPGIACELYVQVPAAAALGLCRIRTGVFVAVTSKDLPCLLRILTADTGRHDEQQRSPDAPEIICHIVQMCRDEANSHTSHFIAEHRIHRINALVEKTCRLLRRGSCTEAVLPPVGIIFRHGLHRRLDNALFVQAWVSLPTMRDTIFRPASSPSCSSAFFTFMLSFSGSSSRARNSRRLLLQERPRQRTR